MTDRGPLFASADYGGSVDVQRSQAQPDGQIVVLGVDEIEVPEVLLPSGSDVRLLADGPDHWLAVVREPSDWVRLGAEVLKAVPKGTVGFRTPPTPEQVSQFVRGWRLAGYRFPAQISDRVLLLADPPDLPLVTATLAARDLVNTPSNTKSPSWMVAQARRVAKACGAEIDVLAGKDLAGFGGVLAVGGGSATPPRVVTIRKRARGPRIVLIGKGITYDSGGLSLKPRESMTLMKTDMAGAAAVLSAVPLIPDGLDVTVVLGLAENAIGARSYRPGDVVTHVGGLTSEVRNTDAEGRMVLADLLAHARLTMDPAVMIDVATLTGAATIALSREYGAVFSTSQELAEALRAAGDEVGESVWQMPLEQSYRPALRSDIADQSHVSDGAIGAGSITAALFLQTFAGEVPWAHLDIAGPARATTASGVRTYGGTGFGAALLGQWLAAGAQF